MAGVGLVALLAACSSSKDSDDPNMMGSPVTPGTPTAGTPAAGQSGAGAVSGPVTAPSAGSPSVGGSGVPGDVPVAGSGGASAGGMGAAGGNAGSGEAGTDEPPPPSGVCDTSAFTKDCKQGGAQWGTPQQLGPCSSGISTYGVKQDYGPYGVRVKNNVGKGFETGGTDDSVYCNTVFIPSFGADPVGSKDLMDTHDMDFALFTVFYPGCMPEGEKFPVITWGNGTCAMPEGYGPLLRYVASFGYIVVAANNREVAGGEPMTLGIDYLFAENDKADSDFYQRIDKDKVGAMGHSQGGGATISAASDPRIKAVIIWNGGTSASKPFLAVSGDRDLGGTPAGMKNAVDAAPRPAAWIWYHQIPADVNGSTTGALAPGHLTLMMESERVIKPAVAWWDLMLKGKDEAKSMFVGAGCTLCDPAAFPSMWAKMPPPSIEFGANAMVK
ncbi:MAG TPA: hypothetical protein VK509_05025 [Polyangiales bacterium]|nr:hypothetical protein [Polyangiales bacterium]